LKRCAALLSKAEIFLDQAAADPVMFRKIDGARDPDAVFADVLREAKRLAVPS